MGSVLKIGTLAAASLVLAGCLVPPSFIEAEKRELRDSASAYQQDALEDLVVTESEYRDAVARTRSCVQDKGWGVGPIEENDGNQLGFTASSTGDDQPDDKEMRACYSEFLDPVARMWVSQRQSLTG